MSPCDTYFIIYICIHILINYNNYYRHKKALHFEGGLGYFDEIQEIFFIWYIFTPYI